MKRSLYTLISGLMACVFLTGCMPYSTGPTQVGVRTVKFSLFSKKGVEDRVYPPGSTYFMMPFINDWHTFDIRLNVLEMTGIETRGDRVGKDDLLFKTVDGNDISLNININWRIDREKAPTILQEVASNDEELKENIIRAVGRSKCRDIFGELATEDFYLADRRAEKAAETLKSLNDILNPYGVIVENVLTGDYRFNPDYQKAIEDRKVAEQRAERNKSEARATEEEFRAKVEGAKGDVAKMKAQADGEFEQAKIKADAEFIQKQQQSKAILAEGLAEAEAALNMNKALTGPGGEAVLKLQIAEAIKGKKIVMVPMGSGGLDVRSMDMNQLLGLYGAKSLAEKPVAPPAPSVEEAPAPAPQPALPRPANVQQRRK